jgi:Na+/melibiose symporter-like transporter
LAVATLLIYLQRTTEIYSVLSSNEDRVSEIREREVEMIETSTIMTQKTNEMAESHTIYETLAMTMRSWSSVGFLFSAITLCMGTSVVENLIFLFFEETLGGTNFQCGLTVVVTVIFEIPIFHYAPKILQAFGYPSMQKVACLAYITRVIGYTFIPKDKMYLVLFLEPLHGVTYACSKTATVQMASEITPEGYEASFQGIISMITSFGSVLGVCLGGWLEEHYSDILLYRLYAFVVLLGLVAYHASIAISKNRNNV